MAAAKDVAPMTSRRRHARTSRRRHNRRHAGQNADSATPESALAEARLALTHARTSRRYIYYFLSTIFCSGKSRKYMHLQKTVSHVYAEDGRVDSWRPLWLLVLLYGDTRERRAAAVTAAAVYYYWFPSFGSMCPDAFYIYTHTHTYRIHRNCVGLAEKKITGNLLPVGFDNTKRRCGWNDNTHRIQGVVRLSGNNITRTIGRSRDSPLTSDADPVATSATVVECSSSVNGHKRNGQNETLNGTSPGK